MGTSSPQGSPTPPSPPQAAQQAQERCGAAYRLLIVKPRDCIIKPLYHRLFKADANHAMQPTVFGHIALSLGLITTAAIFYRVSVQFIDVRADEWKVCPQTSSSKAEQQPFKWPFDPSKPEEKPKLGTDINTMDPPGQQLQQPELKPLFVMINGLGDSKNVILATQKYRLKSQAIQFRQAQQTACSIGVFFFANRNAALSVATAAGILSIASLAFVSKNGWDGTNNAFINIGLTSGLILFTSWTFSQLYGQGVNYDKQKDMVILATDMLNRIASAVANANALAMINANPAPNTNSGTTINIKDANGVITQRVINLTNPKEMAAFINILDDQLRILSNLDFSGDSSFAEQSAKRVGSLMENKVQQLAPVQQPVKQSTLQQLQQAAPVTPP